MIHKKIYRFVTKAVAATLLLVVLAVLLTAFSPIYRFREPAPFTGPDIYNPYKDFGHRKLLETHPAAHPHAGEGAAALERVQRRGRPCGSWATTS